MYAYAIRSDTIIKVSPFDLPLKNSVLTSGANNLNYYNNKNEKVNSLIKISQVYFSLVWTQKKTILSGCIITSLIIFLIFPNFMST